MVHSSLARNAQIDAQFAPVPMKKSPMLSLTGAVTSRPKHFSILGQLSLTFGGGSDGKVFSVVNWRQDRTVPTRKAFIFYFVILVESVFYND